MKKLLVLLLTIGLLAGFLAYQQEIVDLFFKLMGKKEEVGESIATLDRAIKNVRLKRAESTIWNKGEDRDWLALWDWVSTGYESVADITFHSGYFFNLGENSLVVIEEPKQPLPNLIELGFNYGTFQAENKTAYDAILRVRSGNTITEVVGISLFGMSVDKKTRRALVWVKKGRAKITDELGNVAVVNKDEQKEFSTEELEPPEPEPEPEPVPEPKPKPKPKPKPRKKFKAVRRLSRNKIYSVITKHRKKLDACYARRKKITAADGRMTLKLVIKNTGQVAKSDIVNTNIDEPAVTNCMIFWTKLIKFPAFDGRPIEESLNFVFQ